MNVDIRDRRQFGPAMGQVSNGFYIKIMDIAYQLKSIDPLILLGMLDDVPV